MSYTGVFPSSESGPDSDTSQCRSVSSSLSSHVFLSCRGGGDDADADAGSGADDELSVPWATIIAIRWSCSNSLAVSDSVGFHYSSLAAIVVCSSTSVRVHDCLADPGGPVFACKVDDESIGASVPAKTWISERWVTSRIEVDTARNLALSGWTGEYMLIIIKITRTSSLTQPSREGVR